MGNSLLSASVGLALTDDSAALVLSGVSVGPWLESLAVWSPESVEGASMGLLVSFSFLCDGGSVGEGFVAVMVSVSLGSLPEKSTLPAWEASVLVVASPLFPSSGVDVGWDESSALLAASRYIVWDGSFVLAPGSSTLGVGGGCDWSVLVSGPSGTGVGGGGEGSGVSVGEPLFSSGVEVGWNESSASSGVGVGRGDGSGVSVGEPFSSSGVVVGVCASSVLVPGSSGVGVGGGSDSSGVVPRSSGVAVEGGRDGSSASVREPLPSGVEVGRVASCQCWIQDLLEEESAKVTTRHCWLEGLRRRHHPSWK